MDANAHRGGLTTQVDQIWPEDDLLARLGGRQKLECVVDNLYSRIENDPELHPLFGSEVDGDRSRQKMFFEEWMGGEPRYSRQMGGLGTRLFHQRFAITRRTAGRWLGHMTKALREEGVESSLAREILCLLGPMAKALTDVTGPRLPYEIRVGLDLAKLESWATRDPAIFKRCHFGANHLLLKAILRGRFDVVQLLVDGGINVNTPFLHHGLMMTPWCVATHQGQEDIAAHLLEHGARVDIFSAAFLGDLDTVTALLDEDPSLADADDPAHDHRAITPLHHAVRGGWVEVARTLFKRGARVRASYVRLLSELVEKQDPMAEKLELIRLLLISGVSAAHLGPGRWVQRRQLADLLEAHGASVNLPGGDWLRFCAGHLRQADDPELITALIDRGADLSARSSGKTALHLAANAGHFATLEVLLARGMHVDVEDESGNTALTYSVWAQGNTDRVATARLLLKRGANPEHRNHDGATPRDHARRTSGKNSQALLDLIRTAPR